MVLLKNTQKTLRTNGNFLFIAFIFFILSNERLQGINRNIPKSKMFLEFVLAFSGRLDEIEKKNGKTDGQSELLKNFHIKS